ncbi:hypothetical protein DRO48_00115 [Candidatus Bathyarchaeota archaeon]|nr:MAG: hypothetical protein DRO48_00115 [Candidatus Bathyarchaeota archaeon]
MSKNTLLSGGGVIAIGVLLTLIVLLESLPSCPWSPYFLVYAFFAIAIPLWLRACKFGRLSEVLRRHWKVFLVVLVVSFVYDVGADLLYGWLISSMGLAGNPQYDFGAALEALAAGAAVKFGISKGMAMLIYALYILIWAPIGEELFYRGYMYGVLQDRYGVYASAIISTVFFSIRHFTHFFFLTPNVPVIPGLWWALSVFPFGLLMVYAYRKTDSLHIPIIIHFLTNIVDALAA